MAFTADSAHPTATACARTLARRTDLAVRYDDADRAAIRSAADSAASQHRFALPADAAAHRPVGAAGQLFDTLAAARAAALGSRWLPGIAGNFARRAPPLAAPGAWLFALIGNQPAIDCSDDIRTALLALAALIDRPKDFAAAAGRFCVELALHLPATAVNEDNATAEANHDDNGKGEEAADGMLQAAEASGDESQPGVAPAPLPDALCRDYRIFTRRDDRVVDAAELASPAELDRLRAQLDSELEPYRQRVTRLAHRLQRQLLARQRRYWSHDRDEGQLDPSRLARLVADPSRAQVFRIEEDAPFPNTAVTLLLDNSGSMRGRPITIAALTVDVLARAFERCGVKVEILGYTTAAWQGGKPAQDWVRAGSPPHPGRLNALRHIVYKAMDAPWRRARRNLGLMLKEDLLKENIDGEALHWAALRLASRPEPRRLLVVVSDGAPMDKATLAANERRYLDRHLQLAVNWVERNTDIALCALGIGHPVGRYYRRAMQLRSADELGTVLPAKLGEWLA